MQTPLWGAREEYLEDDDVTVYSSRLFSTCTFVPSLYLRVARHSKTDESLVEKRRLSSRHVQRFVLLDVDHQF